MRKLAACPGAGLCGENYYCALITSYMLNSNGSSFLAHAHHFILSIQQAITLHA